MYSLVCKTYNLVKVNMQAIDLSIGERLGDSSETLSGFPQNSKTIEASSSLHKKDSKTNYRSAGRQKNKIVVGYSSFDWNVLWWFL